MCTAFIIHLLSPDQKLDDVHIWNEYTCICMESGDLCNAIECYSLVSRLCSWGEPGNEAIILYYIQIFILVFSWFYMICQLIGSRPTSYSEIVQYTYFILRGTYTCSLIGLYKHTCLKLHYTIRAFNSSLLRRKMCMQSKKKGRFH